MTAGKCIGAIGMTEPGAGRYGDSLWLVEIYVILLWLFTIYGVLCEIKKMEWILGSLHALFVSFHETTFIGETLQ